MHSNRIYRYGHLDGFPSPFVPFPFPFLFLSLSFCSLAALRFVAWLPFLSLLAFVALPSLFGNSLRYLRVTLCCLPPSAVPAFPTFSGLSLRRLAMAGLAIPVFFPYLARISAIFGWLCCVTLTPGTPGGSLRGTSRRGPFLFGSARGDSLPAPPDSSTSVRRLLC